MHARLTGAGAGILALLVTLTSLAATNVIELTYDAAGNITQIVRQTAATLTISSLRRQAGRSAMRSRSMGPASTRTQRTTR
jgi:YD repeat-containing protein